MTHYQVLGLDREASGADVRAAYRRMVREHHPDRSPSKESQKIFLAAGAAYEVLRDPERRRQYDLLLDLEEARRRQQAAPRAQPRPQPKPPTENPAQVRRDRDRLVAAEVARLSSLFVKGRLSEAERLAREIVAVSPTEAVPYAILGDIARGRGDVQEALRMYAYAAQFDGRNPLYQQRYEDLLNRHNVHVSTRRASVQSQQPSIGPALVAAFVTLVGGLYVATANEPPLFSGWTLGMLAMLFVSGVAVGAGLSIGHWLDRMDSALTTSLGHTSPAFAMGLISIANFWLAVGLYLMLGIFSRGHNLSMTRLMGSIAAVVFVATLATGFSGAEPQSVLLWGGNLAFVGALLGWLAADAFR
jgi:curved DNA-binding protein CbpA